MVRRLVVPTFTLAVVLLGAGFALAPSAAADDPPACSDGIDNDEDGNVDFPDDPGCVDAVDLDEVSIPPAPANVEARPGPGASRITLTWDALPASADVRYYRVYQVDSDSPPIDVGANSADPNPRRSAQIDASQDFPFQFTGWESDTFAVTAVSDAGEGPRSAEVSMTPFMACEQAPPGMFELCIGVHRTERIGVLALPQDVLDAAFPQEGTVHVQIEQGVLRVDAAGTYIEQAAFVPRGDGIPAPPDLDDELGAARVRFTANGAQAAGFFDLIDAYPDEIDPSDTNVVGSLWNARFWVWFGDMKLTDLPVVLALPFGDGEPCEGEECNTPAGGAALVASALVGAALLASRRRRRGD